MDGGAANGVFLYSKNMNSELSIHLQQKLVCEFPEINFTSLSVDEKHSGWRVHFSSPEKDVVLAKANLIESAFGEQEIRIAPLTTSLTIHGVLKNGGEQFNKELHEAIGNRFGKLLSIHPATDSGTFLLTKLRACVDVPEIKELEVFDLKGLPHMIICLPTNKEMLTVTFHCRRCNRDDHVQKDCPLLTPFDDLSMFDLSDTSSPSISHNSFTVHSESIDDDTNSSECSNSTSGNTRTEFSFLACDTAEPSSRNSGTPTAGISNFSAEDTNTPASAFFAEPEININFGFDCNNFSRRSSTSAVEDTTLLSAVLQEIIDRACAEVNFIDRNQLNSFFIHVKRKNHLIKITKIFTSNVGGMKTLLERIVALFYFNTTAANIPSQDKQFIKWLQGLVKRFDETTLYKDRGERSDR